MVLYVLSFFERHSDGAAARPPRFKKHARPIVRKTPEWANSRKDAATGRSAPARSSLRVRQAEKSNANALTSGNGPKLRKWRLANKKPKAAERTETARTSFRTACRNFDSGETATKSMSSETKRSTQMSRFCLHGVWIASHETLLIEIWFRLGLKSLRNEV